MLFGAVTAFAVSVVASVDISWMRALAAVVAVMCGVRAVLLLTGRAALELAAPMGFVVLVLCLAVISWRSRRSVRR